MKLCKVSITKNRNTGDTQCNFVYPVGYDAKVLSPFMYQDEGKSSEFCLATVPDDFKFTDDMVEVSKIDAEALVDTYVDGNKDIVKKTTDLTASLEGKDEAEVLVATTKNTEEIADYKTRRKVWCDVKADVIEVAK